MQMCGVLHLDGARGAPRTELPSEQEVEVCRGARAAAGRGAGGGGHVGHKTIPVWMLLGWKVTGTVPLTRDRVLGGNTSVHIPWQGSWHSRGWRRKQGCCGTGGGNEPWHLPCSINPQTDKHLAAQRHCQSSLHSGLSGPRTSPGLNEIPYRRQCLGR